MTTNNRHMNPMMQQHQASLRGQGNGGGISMIDVDNIIT